MIKTLYKSFQHWSEKGSVYIISDPHFSDFDMNWRIKLIEKLEGVHIEKDDRFILRDLENSCLIANYIISEINLVVKPNDTIIFLGDIGNIAYLNLIRSCYKVLIKGNHDKGNSYYEGYFNEIYDGPLMISNKLMLSHEPVAGPWINIHGHQHHTDFNYGFWIDRNKNLSNGIVMDTIYINVSAEINAFRPINLRELIKSGILKEVDDIHRITIDKASN